MLRDIFVAIGIGMSQLGAAVQSVAPDDNKSALANLCKSIEAAAVADRKAEGLPPYEDGDMVKSVIKT